MWKRRETNTAGSGVLHAGGAHLVDALELLDVEELKQQCKALNLSWKGTTAPGRRRDGGGNSSFVLSFCPSIILFACVLCFG